MVALSGTLFIQRSRLHSLTTQHTHTRTQFHIPIGTHSWCTFARAGAHTHSLTFIMRNFIWHRLCRSASGIGCLNFQKFGFPTPIVYVRFSIFFFFSFPPPPISTTFSSPFILCATLQLNQRRFSRENQVQQKKKEKETNDFSKKIKSKKKKRK